MNAKRSSYFVILLAVILLLASACQPAAITPPPDPTQPPVLAAPSATAVIPATQAPAQPSATPVIQVTQTPVEPASCISIDISLKASAVAQYMTSELVTALPASADVPWFDNAPEFRRVTLQGYPVFEHSMKPQIFVYPAGDLASVNENMGKNASDLQALLQTRKAGDQLPFLPLDNNLQVMHAQVQYLDFKSGKGVRFLTQYNNGIVPINNHQLIYTFQGMTSDGKYYIAAVLPVTHPDLPATEQASSVAGAEYRDNLAKIVSLLNQQPGGSFIPDLSTLDALVQSIEIK